MLRYIGFALVIIFFIVCLVVYNNYNSSTISTKEKPNIAAIHKNFIALRHLPQRHNLCGEGISLPLSGYTSADTLKNSWDYIASDWIWLRPFVAELKSDLKVGTVYEVNYQILGTCQALIGVGGENDERKIILVNLLSWKEIK